MNVFWIVAAEMVAGMIIAAVVAWVLFRRLLYPLPEEFPVTHADPYAHEVAEFMREVTRWEHDQ